MTETSKGAALSDADILPCPFCGAGTTQFRENGRIWSGMKYSEPSSVSVEHWCEKIDGQPSRMIERVGRDRASAIEAWNRRAADRRLTAEQPVKLNIIRNWPEGFQDRLQDVWLDVVSFIPNVKLYDLQRVLAEFGFRMEVYEGAPVTAEQGGADVAEPVLVLTNYDIQGASEKELHAVAKMCVTEIQRRATPTAQPQAEPRKDGSISFEEAQDLARRHAKAEPESYYSEPFEPHLWVINAIVEASATWYERAVQERVRRVKAEAATAQPQAEPADVRLYWHAIEGWQVEWLTHAPNGGQSNYYRHIDVMCRDDGRCQYAIDHGAEGLGHCPKGKCAMPTLATPTAPTEPNP